MPMQTDDIVIQDLHLSLQEGSSEIPLTPAVGAMVAQVSERALSLGVRTALSMSKGKLPVDVEFEEAHFNGQGAEVTVSAGLNRFLRARATAVLAISATNDRVVRVDIREIRTLGKISVESMIGPVLDRALDKAAEKPGIDRNPAAERSLLIEPNALLAEIGIPLEFSAGGRWTVVNTTGLLTVKFAPAE